MRENKIFFRASAEDFKTIPGSPLAYWAGKAVFRAFADLPKLGSVIDARIGMVSGDNGRFLRMWHEVDHGRIEYCALPLKDPHRCKWYPLQKGGGFRLWYGNAECVVDWENDGWSMINDNNDGNRVRSHNYNGEQQFKEGITWNSISSASFSCRYSPVGFTFDAAGPLCEVINRQDLPHILGFLSSKVARFFLSLTNPTINFPSGYLESLPYQPMQLNSCCEIVKKNISLSRADWDAYETSWDFSVNPLLAVWNLGRDGAGDSGGEAKSCALPSNGILRGVYEKVRAGWAANCEEMRRLETENNRIFIEAYALQNELAPDVPWNEISLTCNPWYRYGEKCTADGDAFPVNEELEKKLRTDTIKELISYAVGCLMGRYSLDKEGLILASQGETLEDYWQKVGIEKSSATLQPDDDGIIPVIVGANAFADDAKNRVTEFVRVVFGAENLNANLNFIEECLGTTLESYLAKEFWKDHKKMYQNRPIYWLFSSKKGAFQCLVYMHRMDAYTASKVHRDYLLRHIEFLQKRITAEAARGAELTSRERQALKKMQKDLDECLEYEGRLQLVANKMQPIDLDDGVVVNYAKFGDVLAKLR